MDRRFDHWHKVVTNTGELIQEAGVERVFYDMIRQSSELRTVCDQYKFYDDGHPNENRKWLESMVQKHIDDKRADTQREQMDEYNRSMARSEDPNKKKQGKKKNSSKKSSLNTDDHIAERM